MGTKVGKFTNLRFAISELSYRDQAPILLFLLLSAETFFSHLTG